jgi:hypothetical protein
MLNLFTCNTDVRYKNRKSPVQWVPGVLSPRLKRGRGVTLTTHPIQWNWRSETIWTTYLLDIIHCPKLMKKINFETTNSPTLRTLFNNIVSHVLFNYDKLYIIMVSMMTLLRPTMVTVVRQWVQLWDPLLYKYDFIRQENGVVSIITKFKPSVPRWLSQVLRPLQKFERPSYFNSWSYGFKRMASWSPSVTWPPLNFTKSYQIFQQILLGGGHWEKNRHTAWWFYKTHVPLLRKVGYNDVSETRISRPEIRTSSIDWGKMSRFLPADGNRFQSPNRRICN